MIKFCLVSISVLFGGAVFSQSVDLSLNLEEKKSYPLKMIAKTYSNHLMNKQKVEVTAQTQTDLQFLVKKKDRNIFQTQASYKAVSMDMKTVVNGKEMALGKVKEFVNQGFREIVNQPFEMNITDKGKITKIPIMGNIFQKAIRNIVKNNQKKQPLTDFQEKQTLEQLEKSFGSETLMANLETLMAIFPRKIVEVGESWEITSFLTNGMDAKIRTQYTLSEVTPTHITIIGKSDINLDNERVTLLQGQQVFFSVKGEAIREIQLDPNTKWIKYAKYTQSVKGETRSNGDRSHPQGIVIPIEASSEMIIENNFVK